MKFRHILIMTAALFYIFAPGNILSNQFDINEQQIESEFLQLLNDGKQAKAEKVIENSLSSYPNSQRLLFLRAACLRSRFLVKDSYPLFIKVAKIDPNTVSGQCSIHILYLDSRKDIDLHFNYLQALVKSYSKDIVIKWMLAVQCRAHDRNKEGAYIYKQILEIWDPGPVLVHQTYANLLDELGDYETALIERRKAVQLEPKGWSYQGLASTLVEMGRFKEANEAFKKSVELSPEESRYWRSWAWGMLKERRLEDVIQISEKAISLNPKEYLAWYYWGRALELQGNEEDAVIKYRQALKIYPEFKHAFSRLKRLVKEYGM